MTRETKLGLVVGASFLSLAGFVGYNTYFKGEAAPPMPPEPPQPVAQVAQAKALPPQTQSTPQPPNPGIINTNAIKGVPEVQLPGGKSVEPTPPTPPGFGGVPKDNFGAPVPPPGGFGSVQPLPPPGGISLPGPSPVPPPPGGTPIPTLPTPGAGPGAASPPGPLAGLPPGPGAVAPPGPVPGGLPITPPGPKGIPGLETKSDELAKNPSPPPGLPGQPPKNLDIPMPPGLGAMPPPGPVAVQPPGPGAAPPPGLGSVPPPPTDIGKGPPGVPGLPANDAGKKATPPLDAIPPGPLTVDLAPKGPLTADNKTNPAVPGMPPPPAVPPLTGDKSPLPPPTGLGNAPPPGPLAGNPTPPNTDPLLGKVQPSAIDKVPVIPGPGAATTGQIPIPSGQPVPATVSGKPQVEHYDAKVYSVTGEDTDFATLSKKFYGGSDRYAQALIEYNRDVFGNGATAQAPRVTPGSRVEIPPLHVLETKYPNAIAGLKPIQQGGPNSFDSNPAPPAKLVPVVNGPASGSPAPPPVAPWGAPPGQPPAQPPQPIQPSVPPPPTSPGFGPAAPQANANTPTPGTYVVPPPGQHYFQIAQQALGNADRWSEIYKLNTQYDPSNIVPAGTQLQLPAAAPPAVRFSDLRDQMSY